MRLASIIMEVLGLSMALPVLWAQLITHPPAAPLPQGSTLAGMCALAPAAALPVFSTGRRCTTGVAPSPLKPLHCSLVHVLHMLPRVPFGFKWVSASFSCTHLSKMAVTIHCVSRCLFPRSSPCCSQPCSLPRHHRGFCSCLLHLDDQYAPAAEHLAVRLCPQQSGMQPPLDASGGTPGRSTRSWSTLDEMLEHTDAIGLHPSKAARLWKADVRDACTLARISASTTPSAGLAPEDWEAIAHFSAASSTSSTRTSRPDHPVIATTKRGSRAEAKLALSTPAGRAAALAEIDDLVDAPSAHRNRTQRWDTWCELLATYGEDALPVTAAKIRMVAAGLRAGSFRSADPYFLTACVEHLVTYGHRPGPLVAFAAKRFARAVSRGVGPSSLKESFLIEDLVGSMDPPDKSAPRTPQDALWPCAAACLGAWWMTRGIELSAAKFKDVKLLEKSKTVYWNLPASKTDIKAHGVSRAHRCICVSHPELSEICPFHVFVEYLAFLRATLPDIDDLQNLQLFPNGQGGTLSHSATIRMVQTAAYASGDPRAFDSGRFGEHAIRVSGAQFMSRALLMEVYLIQLYGRWSSAAVARYVQNAPLTRTAAPPQQTKNSMNIDDIVKLVLEAVNSKQKTFAQAVDQLKKPENEDNLKALATEVQTAIAAAGPLPAVRSTVSHTKTKFTHLVLVGPSDSTDVDDYLSYCGWHFGSAKYKYNTGCIDAEDSWCQKCFKNENALPDAGGSDSDTEASVSD